MRIQRAKLSVYNARAVDLLKRWQEHRVNRAKTARKHAN
jgi:hypothetical protein